MWIINCTSGFIIRDRRFNFRRILGPQINFSENKVLLHKKENGSNSIADGTRNHSEVAAKGRGSDEASKEKFEESKGKYLKRTI